jgi:protoporphyrinogen oxidase
MPNIGIVGGGMLGMTLALRLSARGHRVTIIEAAPAPGGLAAPQEIGGFTWDRFYHVILLSDRHLRGLLEEIGLGDRLHWGETRTGFYTDGRLFSLSNSLEFLSFPPLSLLDKARLAATILHASRIEDGRALEAVSAVEWLGRWSGKRTLERIWLPLLRSKLGENYRLASAAFIWAIIRRMYGARQAGLKREMFGYVDGGYDTILSRCREHLEQRGVEFRCGTPVAEVRELAEGAAVRLEGYESLLFDHVVLTVPSPYTARLCPQLSPAEKERLRSVVYQGVTCASLLLRRPLGGYYITNITEPWVPFTAVIEMTALVDTARFGGNSLVYLPRYLTQDDAFWERGDDEIRAEFLGALERMYPGFSRDDVLAFQVARARVMQAVSTLHYSERVLPPARTSLPHVSVVNSAQIANGTLNVNETVMLADRKAEEIAPRLREAAAFRAPAGEAR